jgi:hypothetical protein
MGGEMLKKVADFEKVVHRKIVHHNEFCYRLKLIYLFLLHVVYSYIRCDQLKNKSSRRVTYGNPCYSIGSKANSIYFLNDRSV